MDLPSYNSYIVISLFRNGKTKQYCVYLLSFRQSSGSVSRTNSGDSVEARRRISGPDGRRTVRIQVGGSSDVATRDSNEGETVSPRLAQQPLQVPCYSDRIAWKPRLLYTVVQGFPWKTRYTEVRLSKWIRGQKVATNYSYFRCSPLPIARLIVKG